MTEIFLKKSTFELVESRQINILGITVQRYVDSKTKAQHYHFACDDDNQVFMVALKTLPQDSTGVAHILEHVVLCGSEQYPVRDPFFLMLRRSLSNFMNAFTASDWTAYPFATQNTKDFSNLLSVYLDAVFFPNINRFDFMQEGWRLDFTDAKPQKLMYKGVVFNEMKGAMNSATRQLWHHLCRHLFTQSTYHHNSGGKPLDIPKLTHEQLVEFHQQYYHPSNAIFYTYGNGNPLEVQESIKTLVLDRFDHRSDVPDYVKEKRLHKPIDVTEYYAVNKKNESSTHVVIAWLLSENHQLSELLEAHLLNLVLFDNSSSPMHKILEQSDLGEAPSPLCGLEDELREMVMVMGLEGCSEDSQQAISDLIMTELNRLAKEGIDTEQVDACMHQLEFTQREISSGSLPYGLDVILSTISAAVHNLEIFDLLDINKGLIELREKCKDSTFITSLIQKLIDNQHRVTLVMKADETLEQKINNEEQEQLEEWEKFLSDTEKKQIKNDNVTLNQRQLEEPNIELLPSVTTQDVIVNNRFLQPTTENEHYTTYTARTNGIVYTHAVCDIKQLDDNQFKLMPLLASLIPEMGCAGKDYVFVQNQIARYTGDIAVHNQLWQHINDVSDNLNVRLIFSSSALAHNSEAMFKLLHEVIEQPSFQEHKHIKELVSQWSLVAKKGISSNGHLFAMQAASSALSAKSNAAFMWSGLSGINHLIQLSENLSEKNKLIELQEDLAKLYSYIKSNWQSKYLLFSDEENVSTLTNHWEKYKKPENTSKVGQVNLGVQEHKKIVWSIETQVNYCARAFKAVNINHEDSSVFSVVGNYLRNNYLHTAIREQGGAYGGGCQYDAEGETFRFFSYRDPRLNETLLDFSESLTQTLKKGIEERGLEEAKLNAMSKLSTPLTPPAEVKRDYYAHIRGTNKAYRDKKMQDILHVTKDDVKRVIENYLLNSNYSDAVITDIKTAEKLNQEQGFYHQEVK